MNYDSTTVRILLLATSIFYVGYQICDEKLSKAGDSQGQICQTLFFCNAQPTHQKCWSEFATLTTMNLKLVLT